MPYSAELKDAFKTSKIKRIAIVDDAYDAVDFASITNDARTQTATLLRELGEEVPGAPEIAEIEAAGGRPLDEIAVHLDEPAVLTGLWDLYLDAERGDSIHKLLRPLFLVLGVDKHDKLNPLRKLTAILKKTTGVTPVELDSHTAPKDVVDYDLIFLDFYLSDEVPALPSVNVKASVKQDGRKRSIEFLEKVVELADAQGDTKIPLVMLISSLAQASDLPEFRRGASMLASKMAFLPKAFAESNPARTQHVIAGLARHRAQADALWKYLKAWKDAVNDVAGGMMGSLRELELTDYSYMQEYRLTDEKTPLSQYVASLIGGRLTDLVEQKLYDKGAMKHLQDLKLSEALPGRVSPTPTITDIYSSVTTSRVPIAEGKFKPRTWAGDIFIDIASYNDAFGTKHTVKKARATLPKVLAVVTPACDLIPERAKENPLVAVTMIAGDLEPLMGTTGPTTNLLMLNNKPYSLRWNPKWPVTGTLRTMETDTAFRGRYRWVARLRDLYHAELQHLLVRDLGRVGVPVPPTLPEYIGVRVLAKTGSGQAKYEVVRDYARETLSAWSFGSQTNQRAFCLREDLAWEVAQWVEDNSGRIPAADLDKLRRRTASRAWLDEMQRPLIFKVDKNTSSQAQNGVTYARSSKPFEAMGDEYQSAFVVVFAAKPDAAPAQTEAAPESNAA